MKACRRASPVVTLPMSTMQFLQLNYNEKKKKKLFWILHQRWGKPSNGFCICQFMWFYKKCPLLCMLWCCVVFNGAVVPPFWTANELPRLITLQQYKRGGDKSQYYQITEENFFCCTQTFLTVVLVCWGYSQPVIITKITPTGWSRSSFVTP